MTVRNFCTHGVVVTGLTSVIVKLNKVLATGEHGDNDGVSLPQAANGRFAPIISGPAMHGSGRSETDTGDTPGHGAVAA